MDTIIKKLKMSLRISTNAYDEELKDIVDAALLDLDIAGVLNIDLDNKLLVRAITTYARMHFGKPNDYGDYDRLKSSYDEQKAQMATCTLYQR